MSIYLKACKRLWESQRIYIIFHCMRIIIHILLLSGILRDKDKLKLCLVTNVCVFPLCLETTLFLSLWHQELLSDPGWVILSLWPSPRDAGHTERSYGWSHPQFSCGLSLWTCAPSQVRHLPPHSFSLQCCWLCIFITDTAWPATIWNYTGHFGGTLRWENCSFEEAPTSKTNKSPTFHRPAFFHW